jgi:hypothetical protein
MGSTPTSMSTDNIYVLSLSSQSLRTLLRLNPKTSFEKRASKKIELRNFWDFINKYSTAFSELANSDACSLKDRVHAIQFLTVVRNNAHLDDDPMHQLLKKMHLCFIDKMPLETRTLFLQRFIKQHSNDHLCYLACKYGLEQTLSTLNDLNGKFKDEQLNRLLVTAIIHNKLSCVRLLTTLGANVNEKIFGRTHLERAVEEGNLELVQFLINEKADILMCSNDNFSNLSFSALAKAFHLGDTLICNYLLQQRSLSQQERAKVYLELAGCVKNDRIKINSRVHKIYRNFYKRHTRIKDYYPNSEIPLLEPRNDILLYTLDDCAQMSVDNKNYIEKFTKKIEEIKSNCFVYLNLTKSLLKHISKLFKELDRDINFTNKNRLYIKEAINFFRDQPDHLSQLTKKDLRYLSECYTFYQIGKEECGDLQVIGKDFSLDNGLPSSFFIINSSVFRASIKDLSGGTLRTNLSRNSFNALKEFIHSYKINASSIEEAAELLEFLGSWNLTHRLKKDYHQQILNTLREANIEKGEQLDALYTFANRDSAFNLQLFCLLKLMYLNGCIVTLFDDNAHEIIDDPYKNHSIHKLTASTISPADSHIENLNFEFTFKNERIDSIQISSCGKQTQLSLYTLLACKDSQRCILSFLLKHNDPALIDILFQNFQTSSPYSPAGSLAFLQSRSFIKLWQTSFDPEVKRLFALYIIKKLVQKEKAVTAGHFKALISFAFEVLSEKEVKETIKAELQKKIAKEQDERASRD